jgi:hypothetical protein
MPPRRLLTLARDRGVPRRGQVRAYVVGTPGATLPSALDDGRPAFDAKAVEHLEDVRDVLAGCEGCDGRRRHAGTLVAGFGARMAPIRRAGAVARVRRLVGHLSGGSCRDRSHSSISTASSPDSTPCSSRPGRGSSRRRAAHPHISRAILDVFGRRVGRTDARLAPLALGVLAGRARSRFSVRMTGHDKHAKRCTLCTQGAITRGGDC